MRFATSEQSRGVQGHPPTENLHCQRCNLVHLFKILGYTNKHEVK